MPQCAGCHADIDDQFLLTALDRHWHEHCLNCDLCAQPLSGRCFQREGKLFCIEDYFRAFGPKCNGCGEGFGPREMVQHARGRPYHLKCFVCSLCQQPLNEGDEFCLPASSASPVCKLDADRLKAELSIEAAEINARSEDAEETVEIDAEGSETGENAGSEVSAPEDAKSGPDAPDGISSKRRGPRTTIKAKQLETLKTAFAATPKPTRHIRERLAQETGLTMRVIQVWFQNRRSKERRLKQLSALGARRGFFRGGRRLRTLRLLPEDFDFPLLPASFGEAELRQALPPSPASFHFRNMAEYLALPSDRLTDLGHDFAISPAAHLVRPQSAHERQLTLHESPAVSGTNG